MFLRKLKIEYMDAEGKHSPCPIAWIDNFAMRNFTNDAVFDDTLPIADGLMEAGLLVPLSLLQERMEAWLYRKGYLHAGDTLHVTERSHPERSEEPNATEEGHES